MHSRMVGFFLLHVNMFQADSAMLQYSRSTAMRMCRSTMGRLECKCRSMLPVCGRVDEPLELGIMYGFVPRQDTKVGQALTMKARRVTVNDRMQQGYSYLLTEPMGKNFDPDFQPELTPKEMLELGVFGGKYMTDCRQEFPADWFDNARLSPGRRDPELNYFGVDASQPLAEWRRKGWIYEEDPRGWFQWYCRYYMGRRCPDDARQIKRWRAIRRHIAQIKNNCRPGDLQCRRRQRQAVLHWAYDSRKI